MKASLPLASSLMLMHDRIVVLLSCPGRFMRTRALQSARTNASSSPEHPQERIIAIIMRPCCPYRLAFLCASALYLNLIPPAQAAYKEEWVSDRDVRAYASTHRGGHPTPLAKAHAVRNPEAEPKLGNDPIAAFAGRPVASHPRTSSGKPVRGAIPGDLRAAPEAKVQRKDTPVSR
ncbi:hypothetical protein [Burkholderia stagnalis]|uniref:hypothetical protein n=1 Tax=Burkholderia stagnalis TaxID=1503054 RepID=UPI000F810CD7|nr:hypothetical protein [Burkholderia stagnalis]